MVGDVSVGGVNGVVFGCRQIQLSEASNVNAEFLKYVFVCGVVVVVVGVSVSGVVASGAVVGVVVGVVVVVGRKNRTSACTRTRGSSRWRCHHGRYFTRNGWSRCLKLISTFSLARSENYDKSFY